MIVRIENRFLIALINTFGAELTELTDKASKIRYVCPEANSDWEGIAPVLFPNAGMTKDGAVIDGTTYPYRKHGFAKESEFAVSANASDSVTLSLKSDSHTLEYCPFYFGLAITFTLIGRTLSVSALMENLGENEMLCSIGFHPGFSCPIVPGEKAEDYEIVFPVQATASRMILSEGLISDVQPYFLSGIKSIPIKEGMFDGGSFSLTELNFQSVELRSRVSEKCIRVDFDDFPNLVLWAPRYKPISSICIEPWHARADRITGEPSLKDKPDTIILAPGERQTLSFGITAE